MMKESLRRNRIAALGVLDMYGMIFRRFWMWAQQCEQLQLIHMNRSWYRRHLMRQLWDM